MGATEAASQRSRKCEREDVEPRLKNLENLTELPYFLDNTIRNFRIASIPVARSTQIINDHTGTSRCKERRVSLSQACKLIPRRDKFTRSRNQRQFAQFAK